MLDKLDIGTILYTKDGRKTGNAIIGEIYDDGLYSIRTDYGNDCKLDIQEIRKLFYIDIELSNNLIDIQFARITHKNFNG